MMVSTSDALGTTTSVLTMPNMPAMPSTWGRMWQWNAQIPGRVAVITASQRSPGLTPEGVGLEAGAAERDAVARHDVHRVAVAMPRMHHHALVHEPDEHPLADRRQDRARPPGSHGR